MKKFVALIFLCWGVLAGSVSASVRLNEIAWMGTQTSGTSEWIELANDASSSVDLSGWRITALNGSPNILLTSKVAANGYFLLERSSNRTVPDIPADLVASFGSGLSNAGETLFLKDASGVIVDAVVGGTNWRNIGGDNTTKQTAQRSPSGTSWITATATPRAANVSPAEIMSKRSLSEKNTGTQSVGLTSVSPGKSTSGIVKQQQIILTAQKEITQKVVVSASNTASTVLWERGESSSFGHFSSALLWFSVLIVLIIGIFAGLLIVRSRGREVTIADEYTILEDIIESETDFR